MIQFSLFVITERIIVTSRVINPEQALAGSSKKISGKSLSEMIAARVTEIFQSRSLHTIKGLTKDIKSGGTLSHIEDGIISQHLEKLRQSILYKHGNGLVFLKIDGIESSVVESAINILSTKESWTDAEWVKTIQEKTHVPISPAVLAGMKRVLTERIPSADGNMRFKPKWWRK